MFGKVISPMRYFYARSTPVFWTTMRIFRSEKKLSIPPSIRTLIRYYTAHYNDCPFCADISQAEAARESVELKAWTETLNFRESNRFTPAEKALLAYLEEVNGTLSCSDTVFAELKQHFSDKEIVEITWLNATEQYYNHMARPLGLQSDGLAMK